MKKLMCDFETCAWLEDETYVWAWCFCEIGNEKNIKYGNNIDSFFEELIKLKNVKCYFHNLKFDGEFIIYYLLKNGYEHVNKENKKDKSFSTLITDMGIFYSIEIYENIEEKIKITIYDSLKIINQRVDSISKSFDLEDKKLKIDYKQYREKNHVLTNDEVDYIKNDVIIVSKALNKLFNMNLTKMTAGSNAVQDFKNIIGKRFYSMFKPISFLIDKDMRDSYKGGFTYLNPIYKDKIVGKGYVLDVNSLYPSVMYNSMLPINEPVFFEGEYKQDKIYPLYIQRFTAIFELKKGKIPTIQVKNSPHYLENEYIESSNNEYISLTLTNIDLELFKENYNIIDIKYYSGYKFKCMKGIFKDYIDKWIEVKNKSTIEGNKGMRQIAKIQLNSLYGKFATSLKARGKIPYLENDIVKYINDDEKEKNGLYLPMGVFITAYARYITITSSQKIRDFSLEKYGVDKYLYSDTDSIHTTLNIDEIKSILDVDDVKLGAWKIENVFNKAKFIRQKTYIENIYDKKENDYKLKITCAGMPEECYEQVDFDNFEEGLRVDGKKIFKHVKGGVILVDTEFTIKSSSIVYKSFKNMV